MPNSGHGNHHPLFRLYNSSVTDGYIISISLSNFLNSLESKQDPETTFERRQSDLFPLDINSGQILWIGLRYGQCTPPLVLIDLQHDLSEPNEMPEKPADWLVKALSLGGYMAWQAYQLANLLQDPITRLPGRIEFETYLRKALNEAIRNRKPLGLILVNPDEFGSINQRLNQNQGDQTLGEVAEKLFNCLRRSDAVFRYGGAVLVVVLQESGKTATKK